MNISLLLFLYILKFRIELKRYLFNIGIFFAVLFKSSACMTAVLTSLVSTETYADVWPDPVCIDISESLIEIDKNIETKLLDYEQANLDAYRHMLSHPDDTVFMLPSPFKEFIGHKSVFFPSRQCAEGCIGEAIERDGERSSVTSIYYVSHAVVEIYLEPNPNEIYGQWAMLFPNANKDSFVYFATIPPDHKRDFTIFKVWDQLPPVEQDVYKTCLLNVDGNPRMLTDSMRKGDAKKQ